MGEIKSTMHEKNALFYAGFNCVFRLPVDPKIVTLWCTGGDQHSSEQQLPVLPLRHARSLQVGLGHEGLTPPPPPPPPTPLAPPPPHSLFFLKNTRIF